MLEPKSWYTQYVRAVDCSCKSLDNPVHSRATPTSRHLSRDPLRAGPSRRPGGALLRRPPPGSEAASTNWASLSKQCRSLARERLIEIGRASCRERGYIPVLA